MDLNDRLRAMKEISPVAPAEAQESKTVERCKEAYFRQEQDRLLTYWEFLWTQLRYTRKRWWGLQGALLMLACQLLPGMDDGYVRVRSLGAIGCLFVVMIIPELWRNKENDATQVEAACLYSLRQVYAARITLFGMVDVMLMTLFGFTLGRMGFTLMEVLSQFLLPVTVTACICFSLLCGKTDSGETVPLAACLIFGGAWWLVLMNEALYTKIVPPVWAALLALALTFLAFAVRRTVRGANQYWEVDFA